MRRPFTDYRYLRDSCHVAETSSSDTLHTEAGTGNPRGSGPRLNAREQRSARDRARDLKVPYRYTTGYLRLRQNLMNGTADAARCHLGRLLFILGSLDLSRIGV